MPVAIESLAADTRPWRYGELLIHAHNARAADVCAEADGCRGQAAVCWPTRFRREMQRRDTIQATWCKGGHVKGREGGGRWQRIVCLGWKSYVEVAETADGPFVVSSSRLSLTLPAWS